MNDNKRDRYLLEAGYKAGIDRGWSEPEESLEITPEEAAQDWLSEPTGCESSVFSVLTQIAPPRHITAADVPESVKREIQAEAVLAFGSELDDFFDMGSKRSEPLDHFCMLDLAKVQARNILEGEK